MEGPKVSIVMPAYNEAQNIGRVLEELAGLELPDVEIIVVDDGSHDGTSEVARAHGARVIRHPYNRGNGAALRTGIRAAVGEIVVLMDSDGQHNPADIPRLLEKMDSYDMVVGARPPNAGVWYRNLANWIYNRFASYIAGLPVRDLTSGFRAIRAPLAKSLCYLLPNTFSASTTMTLAVARGGYGITYVPIQIRRRAGGKSKISLLRDGFRFFVIMTKVATLFSPLKVFGPLSILVGGPGFVYAIYRLVIGKAWTIPITISLTMGALILVLGLISEQIATLRFQQME